MGPEVIEHYRRTLGCWVCGAVGDPLARVFVQWDRPVAVLCSLEPLSAPTTRAQFVAARDQEQRDLVRHLDAYAATRDEAERQRKAKQ